MTWWTGWEFEVSCKVKRKWRLFHMLRLSKDDIFVALIVYQYDERRGQVCVTFELVSKLPLNFRFHDIVGS